MILSKNISLILNKPKMGKQWLNGLTLVWGGYILKSERKLIDAQHVISSECLSDQETTSLQVLHLDRQQDN